MFVFKASSLPKHIHSHTGQLLLHNGTVPLGEQQMETFTTLSPHHHHNNHHNVFVMKWYKEQIDVLQHFHKDLHVLHKWRAWMCSLQLLASPLWVLFIAKPQKCHTDTPRASAKILLLFIYLALIAAPTLLRRIWWWPSILRWEQRHAATYVRQSGLLLLSMTLFYPLCNQVLNVNNTNGCQIKETCIIYLLFLRQTSSFCLHIIPCFSPPASLLLR